jgi:hypothetical protein
MVISIYFDGTNPNIDAICYDEHCNTTDNHITNRGTIHMIKASLTFIIKCYRNVKILGFELKDQSNINCNNNYIQSLSNYYMAYYSKIWYEDKLKARPLYISEEKYENDKNSLIEYLLTKPDYNYIMKNVSLSQKRSLEPIYNSSKSIKEFLFLLKEYDCIVYKGWLDSLVVQFIPYLRGMEWFIPLDGNLLDNVEIIKLKSRPENLFILKGGENHILFNSKVSP